MDEREFVTRKRAAWESLRTLVSTANRRGGVKALSRDQILSLGPLYRRASSDLAYVGAHAINEDLIRELNALVGEAHALLYEAETGNNAMSSVFQFYMYDFPTLLQKYVKYFLAALAFSFIGGWVAYVMVAHNPSALSYFIPTGLQDSVDAWKNGKVVDTSHVEFSGFLMVHNLEVGLIAFASGVAAGFPTVYALFANGATLGGLAAVITSVHRQWSFWPGILPHGIAELTAIFICGAAGLMMGVALLVPGEYNRADAFRLTGKDAIRLVVGTVPLFIFAGIIEGMFSHLALHPAIRLTFAAVNGIVWYLYLFTPRSNLGGVVNVRSVTETGTQPSTGA